MQFPTQIPPNAPRRGVRRAVVKGAALVGAGLMVLTGCSGGGGKLIEDGTLTAVSSGEYRPFSFYEGEELVGFDKDVSDAVAAQMGLEVSTETGRFDTLVQGVQSSRYDVVIGSMTPTPERAEAVDFTDGYYTSGAQAFVREDSDCTELAALDGAVVGVASGTTYQDYLEEEGLADGVKTYGSDVTALVDLAAGRLDAVVTDKLVGLNQIEEADQDLRTCGDLLYSEEPAFAVRKGNEELREELNTAIATIKEDGTYAEISEKWFGQDIS